MRINHIAIATRDRQKLANFFKSVLNLDASPTLPQPDHGVYTTFIATTPNQPKIELLEELGENSPIKGFLKSSGGGVHHVCLEVASVGEAAKRAEMCGVRVLGEAKIGAHGRRVIFLHPKDTGGVLFELEESLE